MPVAGGPNITKTGILLEVDAADKTSYSGTGTTWTNQVRPGTFNGTLNNISFDSNDSRGALVFTGSNTFVDFGNLGPSLTSSFSFQVAFKPAATASGQPYTILSYASASATSSITFKLDYTSSNQTVVLTTFAGTGSQNIVYAISASVASESWNIIHGTLGSSLAALYVNGLGQAYAPTTGSVVGYNTANRLYAGLNYGSTVGYYTGSVANITVNNADLGGLDVNKNYNALASRFSLPVRRPTVTDADAFAFVEAAGIVDATQQTAINNLVVSLKGAGLWTLLRAAYPLVGGTAYSHKVNLINPSTYPVLWNGGVIHTSLGVVGDGSGYGNTQFVPTALPQDSIHIGVYAQSGASSNGQHIGGLTRFTGGIYFEGLQWLGGSLYAHINNANNGGGPSGLLLTSKGAIILNRRDSGNVRGYVQGATAGTSGFVSTGIYTNVLIFGRNAATYSFAHIGEGLTDAQAISLQNIIQTFQTTLGRSI
jgi:hypothetical protein